MTSAGTRAPTAADAKGQSTRAFWDPRVPAHSDEESEDEENDPSSIADVFADMLSVNEDMILAAAECHTDNDIEGTLAYQRILHRNLMEMANYIDSTFGVYGSSAANAATSTSKPSANEASQAENVESTGVDAIVASSGLESELIGSSIHPTAASVPSAFGDEASALLKTLEADEQLRVIKRSKKLWRKSRHQVREEESVSAIMNETAEKIAAIAVAAREDAIAARDETSIDVERSDLPHPFYQDSSESATGTSESEGSDSARPTAAVPIRIPPSNKIPIAAAPPPAPPAFNMAASLSQLNGFGLLALLAPDALAQMQGQNSNLNMFFPPMFGAPPMPFPPSQQQQPPLLMMDPSMRMPWRGQPTVMPAPPPLSVRPKFSRMCANCRNSHWSLHRCRVTLQHTAPEWVPSDNPSGPRKYTKRANKAKKNSSTTPPTTE